MALTHNMSSHVTVTCSVYLHRYTMASGRPKNWIIIPVPTFVAGGFLRKNTVGQMLRQEIWKWCISSYVGSRRISSIRTSRWWFTKSANTTKDIITWHLPTSSLFQYLIMDNNRSPMDSQQPQLTSTEYSQPQPSTTDDMAGTINNYIHPGATQHFYHSCHITNAAPAAVVPTG